MVNRVTGKHVPEIQTPPEDPMDMLNPKVAIDSGDWQLIGEVAQVRGTYYGMQPDEPSVPKHTIRWGRVLIVIIVIAYFTIHHYKDEIKQFFNPAPHEVHLQEKTPVPVGDTFEFWTSVIEVLEQMERKDMNGSGAVDCIDYALQFYEQYPGSRLIVNRTFNSTGGHLFVAIGQYYIEPTAWLNKHWIPYKDRMAWAIEIADYWQDHDYDPKQHRDVTRFYMAIKNRTMYWSSAYK